VDPSGGTQAPRPFAMAARRPATVLRGSVIGPRGAVARVQERRGEQWVDVGRVRLGRSGAYRWRVPASGTYRVAIGGALGPSIEVG
jgi:hypothetical protein